MPSAIHDEHCSWRPAAATATAGVTVAVRALWWEPRRVRLTRHDLALPRWPRALDGVRVALIADLTAISFQREGAGPPLVLLHGIGHHRQAWWPVIDRLASAFDVIACDVPGFGRSEPLPASVDPTIPAYAGGGRRPRDRGRCDAPRAARWMSPAIHRVPTLPV